MSLDETFPGGEWLHPLFEGLERVRLVVGILALGFLLLALGAKIERYHLKGKLQVLQGGDKAEECAHSSSS